jgi:hypothetical protein
MGHRDSLIQDGYDGGVFLMKSVKFCAEGREIWPPQYVLGSILIHFVL